MKRSTNMDRPSIRAPSKRFGSKHYTCPTSTQQRTTSSHTIGALHPKSTSGPTSQFIDFNKVFSAQYMFETDQTDQTHSLGELDITLPTSTTRSQRTIRTHGECNMGSSNHLRILNLNRAIRVRFARSNTLILSGFDRFSNLCTRHIASFPYATPAQSRR